MDQIENYRKIKTIQNKDNIKFAYVVFRSMEGMARAINCF